MVLYITVTVKLSTCAQAGFPLSSVAINIYEDIPLVYYSQIKPQVMKRAYSVVTYSIVKSTDIWTMTTFFYFFSTAGLKSNFRGVTEVLTFSFNSGL